MNQKQAKRIRKIAGPTATKTRLRVLKKSFNGLPRPMRGKFLDSMEKLQVNKVGE